MKEPSFSTTLNMCRRLLGPHARIWRRDPGFVIGTDVRGKREVKGQGVTLTDAVRSAFAPLFELHAKHAAEVNARIAQLPKDEPAE